MRDIMMSCATCFPGHLGAVRHRLSAGGRRSGQWLMPVQANGSLERRPDGTIIGSRLIGKPGKVRNGFMAVPRRPPIPIRMIPTRPCRPLTTRQAPAHRTWARPATRLLSVCERIATCWKRRNRNLAGARLPADMLTTSGLGPRSGHQPRQRGDAGGAGGTCARYPRCGDRRPAAAAHHGAPSRYLWRAAREYPGSEFGAAAQLSDTVVNPRLGL